MLLALEQLLVNHIYVIAIIAIVAMYVVRSILVIGSFKLGEIILVATFGTIIYFFLYWEAQLFLYAHATLDHVPAMIVKIFCVLFQISGFFGGQFVAVIISKPRT